MLDSDWDFAAAHPSRSVALYLNRNRTMKHKVYEAIVEAIRAGILAEPFTVQDFKVFCPGLGMGTSMISNVKGKTEISPDLPD